MQGQDLTAKIFQTLNVLMCDARTPRTYGTEHVLTHSDMSLLQCIQMNQNAKATELSQYLGITNGAVAQLAKKLEAKGLVVPYHIEGNKKEVYYRLTESGEAACRGYAARYEDMARALKDYFSKMDDNERKAIDGLFDRLLAIAADSKHCAPACGDTALAEKKCIKCSILY
ncbi:MAG TPA: MarR family transcriptional regulator [Clostridiales bacterium]|jgi:DNA-binding MarR family transcriptional regulator|nr:MarR family transcriptional regulator [Clostridiales bacterium]